jgi:spore coat protein U-like protein
LVVCVFPFGTPLEITSNERPTLYAEVGHENSKIKMFFTRRGKMKKLMVMTIVLAVSLISAAAMAGKGTGTLYVSATVINACRGISTDNVDFGNYDQTDPADNTVGQGSGRFRCTKNTSYRTYITRTNTRTDNTDSLAYQLYSDSGRSSEYPSASIGTPSTEASNAPRTADIYGTIAALQEAQPGSYSETITFTVEY